MMQCRCKGTESPVPALNAFLFKPFQGRIKPQLMQSVILDNMNRSPL